MSKANHMEDYILITKSVVAKGRLPSHFLDNYLVQQYAELVLPPDIPMALTKLGRSGGTQIHVCLQRMFDEWLASGTSYDERTALVLMWRARIRTIADEYNHLSMTGEDA